jgi:hypothetical protein
MKAVLKSKLLRAALVVACASGSLIVSKSAQAQSCSGSSPLASGWYAVLVSGYSTQANSAGKYLTAAAYFNAPNCQFLGYNSFGGVNGQFTNAAPSGSFTTNADGTVSLSLTISGQSAVQTYVGAVRKTAGGLTGIENDSTAVATIDLQPMGNVAYPNGATSSLSGTYAVTCTGTGGNDGNLADLNAVTFDGKGNISGIDAYNNNSQVSGANIPYSGTYTVYQDGTFTGTLTGAFTGTTLSGVISASGAEVEYTYNLAGTGGDLACSGKK